MHEQYARMYVQVCVYIM